jgi:hypothetical protein
VFHGYRFNEDDEVRATLKSLFAVLQPDPTSLIIGLRVACDVLNGRPGKRGVNETGGRFPPYTSPLRAQRGAAKRGR